jgi:hypothetical protein
MILKRTVSMMQVYLGALEEAYQRAVAAEGEDQAAALQLFGELALRIGQAHAGFVAGAAASLAHIVKGGIDYALQVHKLCPPLAHKFVFWLCHEKHRNCVLFCVACVLPWYCMW